VIGPRRSSFSSAHRRKRLAWPAGGTFRVLSIDGGGIRGIFPAALLAALEARFLAGRSIARRFDLITGTSTGGILALGLAAGRTGRELLDVYLREGRRIFPPGPIGRYWRALRGVSLYRYDRAALSAALHDVLGTTTLAQSSSRLCIPAFEGHHGEVYIFKTPHHPDYRIDGRERMVTVGEATAAAPSYFRALDAGGYRFVDGGVWANNPIMIGLVDALACFELDPVQVRILSLGCGGNRVRVGWMKAIGGRVSWMNVITAAMDLQSQNALGQAGLLVGAEHLTRVEPHLAEPIALDDWQRASKELPAEAGRVLEGCADGIRRAFLETEAASPQFFWPPSPLGQ